MPRIVGTLAGLTLDLNSLLKELDGRCQSIVRSGAVEWVRTVAAIVPNWSGMSRASLKPIADLVGVPLFVTVVPGAPDRRAEGESQGEAKFETDKNIYVFEWRSTVFHFVYNESNNANLVGFHLRNPGPYQSQRQAAEAFFRTVNPQLRQLPFNVAKHTRITRYIIR